uniref:Uncharacterized protein n=1 Tax=Amphiprion ocellaris TaxID=80972 RepID=A0A3Q1CI78_AMPOC
MELPFSGIELTFIIVAFVIFSLYGLASVCIQPQEVDVEAMSVIAVFHNKIKVNMNISSMNAVKYG